jgi:MFS transporter, DHA1 family, tetracycline resistance protein
MTKAFLRTLTSGFDTVKRLFPILFVVFMDTLGYGLVIPVLSTILFETEFVANQYTHTQISILYGVLAALYPLGQFFGAPILGALSDRYGRKKMLLLSVTGTMVGYALFALGILWVNIPLMLFSRLLDGFTGGNISIAFSAAADLSKSDREKSRNFSLLGVAYAVGLILGPYFGGKLSSPTATFEFLTNESPFWMAALFNGICLIFIAYGFSETLHTRFKSEISFLTGFKHIKKAFEIHNLRAMFLTIFFLLLGFTIFVNFFPVILRENFGYDKKEIGSFFAYAGICTVIGLGVINTLLLRKFSARKLMIFTPLFLGLTFPLLLYFKNLTFIYVMVPFVATLHGMNLTNGTSLISIQTSEDTQGEVMGINESIKALAQSIPSIIGGLALLKDLELPLIIASVSCLLGWLIYISSFRKKAMREIFDT